MGKFFVCLICHAENGSTDEQKAHEWSEWTPKLLQLLDQIEKETGVHIPVTWCCCMDYGRDGSDIVAKEHRDLWKRFQGRGDEIGLHIHMRPGIGPTGKERQFLWSTHEFQHLFLEQSVSQLVDLGFDPPKTYTPGGQVWRDEWAQALLANGFEVDSTIMSLPPRYLGWTSLFEHVYKTDITRYLLWHHRPEAYPFRPYRVSEKDLAQQGVSELVELPVVGWIGCDIYNGPEHYFENSPPYDGLASVRDLRPQNWISKRFLRFEQDHHKPSAGLRERWLTRSEIPIDIWPTLFHPRELHAKNQKRLETFIRTLLQWEDVCFANVYEAVTSWKRSNPSNRGEEITTNQK